MPIFRRRNLLINLHNDNMEAEEQAEENSNSGMSVDQVKAFSKSDKNK